MTYREAISQVSSDMVITSDDTLVTYRYIWNKIKDKTHYLVKQKNDKFNLNNTSNIYTTIPYIQMDFVDSIDENIGIPSCKILRSKCRLPKIMESNYSSVMKGIYSMDNSEKITLVTVNDWIRLSKSKYKNPNALYAFINDGYIYIPGREAPRAIKIEAYFENPEDIDDFYVCQGAEEGCTTFLDLEWNVPSDLRTVILTEVNKDLMTFNRRITPDEQPNNSENIK